MVNVGRQDEVNDFSVVALRHEKKSHNVFETVGQDAIHQAERRPDLELVWPIVNGEIDDYSAAVVMLRGYSRKLHLGLRLTPVWAVVASPASRVEYINRTNYELVTESMSANVMLINDLLAVVISEGIDNTVPDAEPRFMFHMGAGYCIAGMLIAGRIKKNCFIRHAGFWLDICIQRYLYDVLGCVVRLDVCRAIKHDIGNLQDAYPLTRNRSVIDIEGQTHELELSSRDLLPVLSKALAPIVDELRWFLKILPVDQAIIVHQNGMLLSGGCAEMRGLPSWLSEQLNLPVQVAHNPSNAVIQGVAKLMTTPSYWSSLVRDYPKLTRSAQRRW